MGTLRQAPVSHALWTSAPCALTCHNMAGLRLVCTGAVLPIVKDLNITHRDLLGAAMHLEHRETQSSWGHDTLSPVGTRPPIPALTCPCSEGAM